MRALILATFLAVPLAGLAQAPKPETPAATPAPPSAEPPALIRSGTYALTGSAPDGTTYEGALELRATGPETWHLTWRIAGDTTQGAGLSIGNRMVYGYGSGGEPGTGFFEPQANGTIRGVWTQGRAGGTGRETLRPR